MNDQLVNFKVAKLAKEKGFDWDTEHYPIDNAEYSQPTQSLLQKWLREKHKIFIDVSTCFYNEPDEIIFQVSCSKSNDRESLYGTLCDEDDTPIHFSTYEDALEVGLIEGLKLI